MRIARKGGEGVENKGGGESVNMIDPEKCLIALRRFLIEKRTA